MIEAGCPDRLSGLKDGPAEVSVNFLRVLWEVLSESLSSNELVFDESFSGELWVVRQRPFHSLFLLYGCLLLTEESLQEANGAVSFCRKNDLG